MATIGPYNRHALTFATLTKPQAFRAALEALYGRWWVLGGAEALCLCTRTVRRYGDGSRPIPQKVAGRLYLVLWQRRAELNIILTHPRFAR